MNSRNRHLPLGLAALALLAAVPAAAQENINLNYKHRALDCQWLEREYDRVLAANENKEEGQSLTEPTLADGVLSTRVMTWPFFLLSGDPGGDGSQDLDPLTDLGGTVNFSGDPVDINEASIEKNCYELTDRLKRDLEGIAPPERAPVLSVLGNR